MMLALTQPQGIILVVGGGIFVLIAGGVLVLRGRRAAARPDIPVAMRPGPSDADLETPLLNKLQGWGVLLVVFFVIWVPMTWLFEPDRNLSQEQALLTDAIHRGEAGVQLGTEENQGGIGCSRCHGPELQGSRIIDTTTGTVIPTPNLTTICGGPWTGHPKIYSLKDVYATIEQGRGIIMPSWSIRYAGALNDQQINDMVNYIVSIQDETQVTPEHNVCVNADATKAAVTEFLNDDLSKKPSPTTPSL